MGLGEKARLPNRPFIEGATRLAFLRFLAHEIQFRSQLSSTLCRCEMEEGRKKRWDIGRGKGGRVKGWKGNQE